MFFDYYRASILTEDHDMFFSHLRSKTSFDAARDFDGMGGYEFRRALLHFADPDAQHASVHFGGRFKHPNIEASGWPCEEVVTAVRSMAYDHKVSRIDVAEDFSAEGLFERLYDLGTRVSTRHGVKTTKISDPTNETGGTTLMIGGKSSPVRCRIYEKGYEQYQNGKASLDEIDPHLVRVEFQVRPLTADKQNASFWTHEQAVGYSRWARHLWRLISDEDLPRVTQTQNDKASTRQKIDMICQQWAGSLYRIGQCVEVQNTGTVLTSHADALERALPILVEALRDAAAHRDEHVSIGTARPVLLDTVDQTHHEHDSALAWIAEQKRAEREAYDDYMNGSGPFAS